MSVFADAISLLAGRAEPLRERADSHGLAGWLFDRLHHAQSLPRLALVERISLGPRQTLALIEADGQRILVATSPEGSAVFHPLRLTSVRQSARSSKTKEVKSA